MEQSFEQAYLQYNENISTLRVFFTQLHPLLESAQTAQEAEVLGDFKELSDSVGKELVLRFIRSLVSSLQKIAAEPDKAPALNLYQIATDGAGTTDPKIAHKLSSVGFSMVSQFTRHRRHPELLNRSVLVSLVGFYEVLLSDLLHVYYRLFPSGPSPDRDDGEDREDRQSKQFSFEQVASFKTLDEFVDYVIERRIDGFLRQSALSWARFFLKRLKIDMARLVSSEPDWFEYFQRRHIIVHNGARVSRLYLQNVPPDWIKHSGEGLGLGRQCQFH